MDPMEKEILFESINFLGYMHVVFSWKGSLESMKFLEAKPPPKEDWSLGCFFLKTSPAGKVSKDQRKEGGARDAVENGRIRPGGLTFNAFYVFGDPCHLQSG